MIAMTEQALQPDAVVDEVVEVAVVMQTGSCGCIHSLRSPLPPLGLSLSSLLLSSPDLAIEME